MLTELKSKLKNHYRAHRLSFWLNLVPDLHKPGSDDVPRSHHLLDTEQVGASDDSLFRGKLLPRSFASYSLKISGVESGLGAALTKVDETSELSSHSDAVRAPETFSKYHLQWTNINPQLSTCRNQITSSQKDETRVSFLRLKVNYSHTN